MTPADLAAFKLRSKQMTRYQIENTHSGIILGVYEAETENQALDAMARDAGYEDWIAANAAAAATWDELLVTVVE